MSTDDYQKGSYFYSVRRNQAGDVIAFGQGKTERAAHSAMLREYALTDYARINGPESALLEKRQGLDPKRDTSERAFWRRNA